MKKYKVFFKYNKSNVFLKYILSFLKMTFLFMYQKDLLFKASFNLFIVFLLVLYIRLLECDLIAQTYIKVLPGTNVEVGEEVYFDASYYAKTISDTLQFEWDFGDGYRLYADSDGIPFETGLCAIHYFMKPGKYIVKLTGSIFNMYTSPPKRIQSIVNDSITITVSGEAPLEGFELWHAPFHARTAQYLYATVPNGYIPSQVTVRVEKVDGGYSKELKGTTIGNKQRFLLNNASLPAGNYVVIAELKNGNTVVSRIREKFSKPYDGAPKVGINENNAFVLNGKTLFFPISPYMLDLGKIPLWAKVSNALHTEGYYLTHTPATWSDYITNGNSYGLMSVGPGRWQGFKNNKPYTRNSNIDSIVFYVRQAKNTPGLLGWCWDDEPNMGGRINKVPAHVCAGWDFKTRIEDPQHPTTQQYYGYDWNRYYKLRNNFQVPEYTFMRGAFHFGGKKHFISDFFTHDVYPIEAKDHATLIDSLRGVIDLWLENLDDFIADMAGLVPLGTIIETQNVTSFQNTRLDLWDAGPTPEDVRTQIWGAVVHGIKYVGYFQYFAPTPADNFSALGEFKEAVTALTPVILSPPSTRTMTHNCNTRGNRVDIMVREYGSDVYVFAVRVTEPESEWNEVYEPEKIYFELNTGINVPVAYDELPKYQWKYIKLDATEGQTTFNCTVPEGCIVPNSVIVCAVKRAPSYYGFPDSLIDRWTKKAYPTAFDMRTDGGNLKYGYDDGKGNIISLSTLSLDKISGAVNYSTGQIQLNSHEGIPEGRGYVRIAYAPANRQARAIPIRDGVIIDYLERNAVRIYRIPTESKVKQNDDDFIKCGLYKNYPNPFNEYTNINFILDTSKHVSIDIYNINGQKIKTLIDDILEAKNYVIEWNGTNTLGHKVSSGIYFYKFKTNGATCTKKIILLE